MATRDAASLAALARRDLLRDYMLEIALTRAAAPPDAKGQIAIPAAGARSPGNACSWRVRASRKLNHLFLRWNREAPAAL